MTERGRDGSGLALLAGAYTDIWLEREDLGIYVTVAVS